MSAILPENRTLIFDLLDIQMQSTPFSNSFRLTEEKASPSESQSPQFTGNWQKRENGEHSDGDEDIRLHELMEDIKRYIRSIDIGNL